MISEKQLVEYFDSFWGEHFPLLNATFVKQFNSGHKERLKTSNGSPVHPISMGRGVDRFDLVAELAFELAAESKQGEFIVRPDESSARSRAINRIAMLHGVSVISQPTQAEENEAAALLMNYKYFFDLFLSRTVLQFRPRIRGIGILDEMEGDFCSSDTLFEVKAVNRNVQSTDLRQVICYLIAGLASRNYSWTRYCIFNPRLAVYYIGRVDDLLGYLSGRFVPECIRDVVDALMEREQPIETRF